ncbi:M56 family metallopeptidase [Sediminibacillus albus]|uniref:Zn-dependent protease with chaperone function n=1 Tax=Sediminibacillus albus TaxID=407036 RepID=A0A1G8WNI8_9BACI|nr:M56 family metallopeptidase [Sediminibacillus albus]SDJ79938.1 Zn-dependent protease with chaperone function [Sediminibacillus albus]
MLPNLPEILLYLFLGVAIQLIGSLMRRKSKKWGVTAEAATALLAVGFNFYHHGFLDGFIYIAFLSSGWMAWLTLTGGEAKYRELKQELKSVEVEQVVVTRKAARILLDIGFALLVFAGAVLFLLFGPETSPLKLIIAFGMLSAVTIMIKRLATYQGIRIYYSDANGCLYLLSRLNARKFPVKDLESMRIESTVDILKLHPFFTLFTANSDFTTSFQQVLRLQFPGEAVYLTIDETEQWRTRLAGHMTEGKQTEERVEVLPFYHRNNIKRMLGKLYFAMTVKGISAYTGIVLLLYLLHAPVWLMLVFAVSYWLFNLYISDHVLKIAMDARETHDTEVIAAARRVFARAGIPDVKVFETESAHYNGLATGMNIGRSMVTLTTATLKLPIEVIEGILAHEAVHVRKRDVMWGQMAKAVLLLVYLAIILLIIDQVTDIEAIMMPLFLLIWLLMILFPVYQSFYSQWMEVRADHLGASFLEGGAEQMADSLTVLATRQDEDMQKNIEYSEAANERKVKESSLDRSPWWLRLMEFQFMPHPPMYWRVQVLKTHQLQWGKAASKLWFIARWKESFLPKERAR